MYFTDKEGDRKLHDEPKYAYIYLHEPSLHQFTSESSASAFIGIEPEIFGQMTSVYH